MKSSSRRLLRLRPLGLLIALSLLPAAVAPTLAFDKEYLDKQQRREEQRESFLRQQQHPSLVGFQRQGVPSGVSGLAATPCVGGFAGIYPCNNVDLLTFMPLSSIGGGSGNDIWGWTDPLDGREYAIMGRTSGTSFVDITDPVNPLYLGNLPPHTGNSSWRDIKVFSNHAFIVSEASGHGMQVFDLTQLRSVVAPPATFTETAHYDDFGSAHNIAINEDTGFAYVVGSTTCSGGPHFIDISSPTAPVFAGCHIETQYTHDTQCVVYDGPDADHVGKEVCFNSNTDRVNIIDVTTKSAPLVLSSTTYTGSRYTHQGWLTEDHLYWLQGDELDEQNFGNNTRTFIFDVSDLDAPSLVASWDSTTTAIDHNLYVLDGYIFQANYRAGLQIYDLSDVANGNLIPVGRFDIYPSSDSASFNGAWSVYPYFESGTVVVSGIEQGLFILRPTLAPEFDLALSTDVLSICEPGDDTTTATLADRNGYVGNVTLSTSGLPAGAADSFTLNPVGVPGSSEVTISASGVVPGSYPFTISAGDGSLLKEQQAVLNVADALPGSAIPLLPADGAVDVSRLPTLQWAAATQGLDYLVELSSDAGFGTIVFSTTTDATTAAVSGGLDPFTTYYWRVTASNGCGAGIASAAASFTTLEVPRILLVDDDDNSPDVRAAHVDTLTALGEDFDVWDTNNTDDEPSAVALAPYDIVIWFTGDEFGGVSGPGGGGESALQSWLDDSGCLLIDSQDYYYDRGLTGLMTGYLGLAAATSDVAQSSATGQGSAFAGLGPYTLSFPYSNWTDEFTPGGGGEAAFTGSQGISAVDKDTGIYRSAFWSFGLETLPTPADREAVLGTFISWCDALDADSDGAPDVQDCAPADGSVWAAPSEARQLMLDGGASTDFVWKAPLLPGGNALLYDLVRSSDPSDFNAASCVENGETDLVALDSDMPANLYCYLVRARNVCGSNLGQNSQSLPRSGGICP